MTTRIRAMLPADWPTVRRILDDGIRSRRATFATSAPTWEEFDTVHLPDCRYVAVDADGTVLGWATLSAAASGSDDRGVAEVEVYVDTSVRRQGIGRQLLRALVDSSEANGRWMLQTMIFPENDAARVLHLACGFRVVGRRERIGQLDGEWKDVLLMERRSPLPYQRRPGPSTDAAAPTSAEDYSTIDGVLAAMYAGISGPAGREPDWTRQRALFAPQARLVPTYARPDDESTREVLTMDEYIASRGPFLRGHPFFEREIARHVERFGHLAQVLSVYESSETPNGAAFARGVNFIHLVRCMGRWWIQAMTWGNETPGVAIPDHWLSDAMHNRAG